MLLPCNIQYIQASYRLPDTLAITIFPYVFLQCFLSPELTDSSRYKDEKNDREVAVSPRSNVSSPGNWTTKCHRIPEPLFLVIFHLSFYVVKHLYIQCNRMYIKTGQKKYGVLQADPWYKCIL